MGETRWAKLVLFVAIMLASCTATKRYALVIGNAKYQSYDLNNLKGVPVTDARAVRTALEGLRFVVGDEPKLNLTKKDMEKAIIDLGNKLGEKKKGKHRTIVVVYYSGHGIELEGKNYLIPVDANLRTQENPPTKEDYEQLIHVDRLVYMMQKIQDTEHIVILDACRADRAGELGLADSIKGGRTLMAYAAQPGLTASNEKAEDSNNSLYTYAFLKALRERGKSARRVFEDVTERVGELSNGKQSPYHSNTGPVDFVFNPWTGADIPKGAH